MTAANIMEATAIGAIGMALVGLATLSLVILSRGWREEEERLRELGMVWNYEQGRWEEIAKVAGARVGNGLPVAPSPTSEEVEIALRLIERQMEAR